MHSFASQPSEKVVVYKIYATRERVSPPLTLSSRLQDRRLYPLIIFGGIISKM